MKKSISYNNEPGNGCITRKKHFSKATEYRKTTFVCKIKKKKKDFASLNRTRCGTVYWHLFFSFGEKKTSYKRNQRERERERKKSIPTGRGSNNNNNTEWIRIRRKKKHSFKWKVVKLSNAEQISFFSFSFSFFGFGFSKINSN